MKGRSWVVLGILGIALLTVAAWAVVGYVQRPDPAQLGERREIGQLIGALSYRDNPMLALLQVGTVTSERTGDRAVTYEDYVQAEAAYQLGEIGAAGAVEPLIALYQESLSKERDEGGYVRVAVIEALGKLADARAVDTLIAASADPFRPTRQVAVQALGGIDDQGARDFLKAIVTTRDVGGLIRLVERRTSEVVPFSESEHEALREEARKAFLKTGGKAEFEYLLLTQSVDVMAEMGEGMVAPLIEALSSDSVPARARAATVLGEMGEERALKPLAALVTDPEPRVRLSAVDALWQLDTREAEEGLAQALADPDEEIRVRAAKALGDLHRGNATALLHYLQSKATASPISRVLIRLGDAGTEQALAEALREYGDKDMADAYLNSGNKTLVQAAKDWGSSHGYMVIYTPGAASRGTWGQWY